MSLRACDVLVAGGKKRPTERHRRGDVIATVNGVVISQGRHPLFTIDLYVAANHKVFHYVYVLLATKQTQINCVQVLY